MEICLYTYIHMCILLPEEKTEGAFVGDLGIQEFHFNFFFQNRPPLAHWGCFLEIFSEVGAGKRGNDCMSNV